MTWRLERDGRQPQALDRQELMQQATPDIDRRSRDFFPLADPACIGGMQGDRAPTERPAREAAPGVVAMTRV